MSERTTPMRRSEQSAEAVVAAPKPARASKPGEVGSLWQGEGPNDREGEPTAHLATGKRQKPTTVGRPGSAGVKPRAGTGGGEPEAATSGPERPGTMHLMEEVIERANLMAALKRVKKNRGGPGIDRMTVEDLPAYLREVWPRLREQLLAGSYRPGAVLRKQIPKSTGGMRELGIPTVLDRFIQQAILQVLQPRFDPTFSEHSHGFRPGRRAHDAIVAAQRYVQAGRRWVVDLDLERFFDRVNHDVLMERLSRRVADKRLLRVLRRYLEAGIMADGVVMERHEGTPQGGPLSPLLANVLLDEVDRELERRGHAFVRYADDCAPRRRRREAARSTGSSLAAQEMRVGPSDSGCRTRVQTTGCCSGPMIGVVSETEKAGPTRQVCAVKTNASEPSMTCRKRRDVHQNRAPVVGPGQARAKPADGSSGDRHEDGVSTAQALVWNVGTFSLDAKRELQAVDP